ncbi:ITA7 protein, partial [Nothocercus julius]|nr:ITA7 protein [Nothocercus julius]
SCLVFQCPLRSFERAAVLQARGRLWNSTFLEEFLAVTSVELIVRASVSITSAVTNLVLKDASIQVCVCPWSPRGFPPAAALTPQCPQIPVSVYLDPGAAVAGGVPWWVIVLAILAGVLVLALLVFVLWK